MESNLDAPQNREIAAACGLTVWQLEGLLHRRLNDSPVHTCSYCVPGILARCFRCQFGTSPRGLQKFSDERLRRVRPEIGQLIVQPRYPTSGDGAARLWMAVRPRLVEAGRRTPCSARGKVSPNAISGKNAVRVG
jgi:hypothetical protein